MSRPLRFLVTAFIVSAAALVLRAQPYVVGQTYFGANNYIEYQPGDLPIIITAPHGGTLSVSSSLIPDRANGTYNGVTYDDILTDNDTNTQDLARKVAAEIFARTGHRPHLIINLLPRIKLDANREIGPAALGNARAEQAWRDYHETFIAAAKAAALASTASQGTGPFYFFVDLHGHGTTHPDRLELGYNLNRTDLSVSDTALNRAGVLYDTSLRTLPLARPGVTLATVLRGSRSIGDFMETLGFASSPSPLVPAPENSNFFQGGYTTRTHTCWTDNQGGQGVQIECHYTGVRDTASNRTLFARALAQALNGFLYDNYGYSLGASSIYTLSTTSTTLTAGGPALIVTVNRSGYNAYSDTLALSYGGTAVRNTDYTASANSVTFSSGQTSRTFVITPLATGGSGDQTLTIALAPVVPQTADPKPLTLTLARGSTPIVRAAAAASTVSEADDQATFTLTRTNSAAPLTVNLAWSGSAVPRRHYLSPGTSASFAAGESSLTLAVPLVNDGVVQPSRQLTLTVTSGADYLVGATSSASVTILDDDRPPGLALWLARGPSNGRLADESGFGRHGAGVPENSPSSTSWSMGSASGTGLAFNGAYQAAFAPRFTLDPADAFTLSFRFSSSSTNTTNQNLVSFGPRGDPGSLHVYVAGSSTLRTYLNDSTGALSSSALDATVSGLGSGTWHLYTLTADPSGGRKVYIDGALVKSASGWSGSLDPNQLLWLGWNARATTSSSGYYSGALADVRVYQRALSAAEVAALSSGTYTFATWLAEQGLPASASASDDNDGDGWPNALEYALGSNGNAAASTPQVTATRGDGTVQFEFTRRTDATDVGLVLQASTSPDGPWLGLASLAVGANTWSVDPSITATDDDGVVTLLVNDETEPRYWRLRAAVGLNSGSYDVTPPTAPVLLTQPADQTLATGDTLTLTVSAAGTSPLTYAWSLNGTPIPGATSSIYTVANVTSAHAGSYTVTVTNAAGSVTSAPATVSVTTTNTPTIVTQPVSQNATIGGSVTFTVSASGSGPFTYQWRKNGTPIAGATSASLELTNLTSASAGSYTVVVTGPGGSQTSAAAVLTIHQPSYLTNLSVRAGMVAGQNLIVGFVVEGGGKPILIRAAGPGLGTAFGLDDYLADPKLILYAANGDTLSENDDWDQLLADTFTQLGAFPFEPGSKDAALLHTLTSANTAHAPAGSDSGTQLVELYDAGAPADGKLTNVSARYHVGTGNNILIAGFVVGGTGYKSVLIRAVGPGLAHTFGVTGVLTDPKVGVYDKDGKLIAENDDWSAESTSLSLVFDRLGAFDLEEGSKDAAFLISLPAGMPYTAQVRGADGGTGEALVEIYDANP